MHLLHNQTSIFPGSYPVVATGGTVTTYTQGGITYKLHTFTGNGVFTVSSGGSVETFLVGAGGAGGTSGYGTSQESRSGGGGGSAGQVVVSSTSVSTGAYSIIVGPATTTQATISTTALGLSAAPGKKGANPALDGASGVNGSGAGAYVDGSPAGNGGVGTNHNGGSGGNSSVGNNGGGGGAGQGGNGTNGSPGGQGGAGGVGYLSTFSGTSKYYAGGGGGGVGGSGFGGLGGSDVGGRGASSTAGPAGNGVTNTGSGGGAAAGQVYLTRGSGAAGIVMIRYPI